MNIESRLSALAKHNSSMAYAGVLVCILFFSQTLVSQETTGTIQGRVTDSSGAAVVGAHIATTNEATGESRECTVDQNGNFLVLELAPGNYTVSGEGKGFKRTRLEGVTVVLARRTALVMKMEIGEIFEQVTVSATNQFGVDPVSTEIGNVITARQLEQFAIIGRNVMDAAQLSPGVQLRDGSDLDPTKNNFTIAAFQGRSGRETQVEWDGLSIQDHTVGGTVQEIGLDTIQEFQVAQATLSPAQSVSSGGAVNIVSRSGTNNLHGSLFEFFRDQRISANAGPIKTPYDRNQPGGRLGGALVRNRLFYFIDAEQTQTRDSFFAQSPGGRFPSLSGFFPKPFHENFAMTRIDGSISKQWTGFARFSYGNNNGVVGFPLGGAHLDGMFNRTHSLVFAGGATFANTDWFQSFKYGYVVYSQDLIPDLSLPTQTDSKGRPYNLRIDGGTMLSEGPNTHTNQLERQRTYQFRYDAGRSFARHTLRFGFDLTKWSIGGDFPLYVNGPRLDSSSALSNSADPTDYPLLSITVGNGLGFLDEIPGLGLPHGANFQWRPAVYIHDTLNLFHNLTVNGGVRWLWMSGQFNSDLKRPALLDQLVPGLSKNTHTPKTNFGPEFGITWDPRGDGKTIFRSAAGLYFEELTFDSYFTDRTSYISSGVAFARSTVNSGSGLIDPRTGAAFASGDSLAASFGFPAGTSAQQLNFLFTQPIGAAATHAVDLSLLLQAATAQIPNPLNAPSLFDRLNEISLTNEGDAAWDSLNIKTPRVFQLNFGLEREVHKGIVASAEYVKVRGMRFPLIVDINHVGEASVTSFDRSNAVTAIGRTNASVGCPNNSLPASIDCAIATKNVTIASYGANGLGEGRAALGFAFRGRNPEFGVMDFMEPISTNDYNAMNLRLQGRFGGLKGTLLDLIKSNTLTIAYTFSRGLGNIRPFSNSQSSDQTLEPLAWDNAKPTSYVGSSNLDRTHILNFGSVHEISGGFWFSQVTHWFSPLAQNTLLPTAFSGCKGGSEEIFCTDVTGDGTSGDLLPMTKPGAFGRSLRRASGLNSAITAYNTQQAGKVTPAGQLLVSQGLFTPEQLQELKGVMPVIPLAPPNEVGVDPLVLTDVRLSWKHKLVKDIFQIEPSLDVYNVFNRAHFDPPGSILAADLTGTAGHINGTTPGQRTNLQQRGSGTFEMGARRQMQIGIRVSF